MKLKPYFWLTLNARATVPPSVSLLCCLCLQATVGSPRQCNQDGRDYFISKGSWIFWSSLMTVSRFGHETKQRFFLFSPLLPSRGSHQRSHENKFSWSIMALWCQVLGCQYSARVLVLILGGNAAWLVSSLTHVCINNTYPQRKAKWEINSNSFAWSGVMLLQIEFQVKILMGLGTTETFESLSCNFR